MNLLWDDLRQIGCCVPCDETFLHAYTELFQYYGRKRELDKISITAAFSF